MTFAQWVVDALPMALGPLRLSHDQFYALTPGEFNDLVAGWKWREDYELQQRAHLVAHLLQPHYKQRIRPRDLYRKWTTAPTPSEQARERDFEQMMRTHELRLRAQAMKRGERDE